MLQPTKILKIPIISLKSLFHTNPILLKNPLPPRPKINEDEITEVFIKGGGKGGQKINKTNSKVQLTHLPTGIVVSSQATRSRDQNRKHARSILAMKLQELNDPENSRLGIIKQLKHEKKSSSEKKKKRKYRNLAENVNESDKQENDEILEMRKLLINVKKMGDMSKNES